MRRGPRFGGELPRHIHAALADGTLSNAEIAAQAGVTRQQVWLWRKKLHPDLVPTIPTRSHNQAASNRQRAKQRRGGAAVSRTATGSDMDLLLEVRAWNAHWQAVVAASVQLRADIAAQREAMP